MRFTILAALCAVAANATVPAVAQTVGNEIVVTGKSEDEVREQSRAFVRTVSATPVSGQFARWKQPICPKTIGLKPENADVVTDKIRKVALDAGAKVDDAECVTNLLVVFTADADRDIGILRKKGSRVLGRVEPREASMLAESGRPVRWWYNTSIEGADGSQMNGMSAGMLTAKIEGNAGDAALSGGMTSNGETQALDGYSSSNIGSRIRAKIDRATFIIDANAAKGRTLKSFAAYAALVTLARIRMDSAVDAEDSILGLFAQPEAGADDLTRRDKAFLAALYSAPANRDAKVQERAIANAMAKALLANQP